MDDFSLKTKQERRKWYDIFFVPKVRTMEPESYTCTRVRKSEREIKTFSEGNLRQFAASRNYPKRMAQTISLNRKEALKESSYFRKED